jgi:hypothetical protein
VPAAEGPPPNIALNSLELVFGELLAGGGGGALAKAGEDGEGDPLGWAPNRAVNPPVSGCFEKPPVSGRVIPEFVEGPRGETS